MGVLLCHLLPEAWGCFRLSAGVGEPCLAYPCRKCSEPESALTDSCPLHWGEAAEPVELGHRVSPGGPEGLVTASVRAQEAWAAAWSGSPVISLHSAFKGKNTPVSSD